MFMDYFCAYGVRFYEVHSGTATDVGGGPSAHYRSSLTHHGGSSKAVFSCDYDGEDGRCSVVKSIKLSAGEDKLVAHYVVEALTLKGPWRFGVEFNVAALASSEDDR